MVFGGNHLLPATPAINTPVRRCPNQLQYPPALTVPLSPRAQVRGTLAQNNLVGRWTGRFGVLGRGGGGFLPTEVIRGALGGAPEAAAAVDEEAGETSESVAALAS